MAEQVTAATAAAANGNGNGNNNRGPHIVLVPLMAQGHIIPMIDMAHLLVDRGATVSYITTTANAARIKPVIDQTDAAGLPIRFVVLELPCAKVGLPEGCESVEFVTTPGAYASFYSATELLREPLELYIRGVKPAPSCMIADYALPWTMDAARNLNMLRFVFHGPSCYYILCVHRVNVHRPHDGLGLFEPVALPDMPQETRVTKAQAPGWFPPPELAHISARAIEAETTADGIVANSFFELEKDSLDYYRRSIGKPVWAIGPLSLRNKDVTATRGNKSSVDEKKVSGWLGTREPRSVMYVNFGSIFQLRPAQLIEIGRGLEASGRPFIWVVKETEKCAELDEWVAEGFEERTEGRGLVITGWAPQMAILSHPAVGGFLTHCGWNSILEAVSSKVPMLTWPCFSDQILNHKLVVEVLGIGVSVGVDVPVYFTKEPVKGEAVAAAIGRLMGGGEEGEAIRERTVEFGERARAAMEAGGSSYMNLSLLMDHIRLDSISK